MKVKKMGITEIMRRIWLFSAEKIKSYESFSKQPTQLIITAHNCHFGARAEISPTVSTYPKLRNLDFIGNTIWVSYGN